MKRLSTLWMVFTGFFLASYGQVDRIWQNLDEGLKAPPTALTSGTFGKKDVLIAAYETDDYGAKGKRFVISVWSQSLWSHLGPIFCDSGATISTLQIYKGDLYIGGRFGRFNGLSDARNLVRWNREKRVFEKLPNLSSNHEKSDEVNHLDIYDEKLVVAGKFANSEVTNGKNLTFFDGEKWVPSGINELELVNGPVYTTLTYDSDFYIGGDFTKIGTTRSLSMARFDGDELMPFSYNKVHPLKMVGSQFGVIVCGLYPFNKTQKYFYQIQKDSAYKFIEGFEAIYEVTDLISDGKVVYASGKFKLSGDSKIHYLVKFVEKKWEPMAGSSLPEVTHIEILEEQNDFVAAGEFESFRTVRLNHIAKIGMQKKLGAVSGRIYFDKNNNCKFEDSLREEYLDDRLVLINPGNLLLRPRENGLFFAFLEPENYEITVLPGRYWYPSSCSSLTKNIKVEEGELTAGTDFPLVQKSGIKDLSIDLISSSGPRANVNNTQLYFINYENLGSSELVSGQVTLKFDSRLNNMISSPPPADVNGDTAVWNIADLSPGEKGLIKCLFNVDPLAKDELQLEASISQPAREEDDGNNYSSLTQQIMEEDVDIHKAVNPGKTSGDTSYVHTDAEEILYQISFANYTQDTVRSVYVIDTIPLNATIKSIDDVSFSHSVKDASYPGPAFSNTYILVYKFEGIDLPPNPTRNGEIVNDEGHAAFRLSLKNNLSNGMEYTNTATVVFDYDFDKRTNTVFTIVDDNVGVQKPIRVGHDIQVYPNPVQHQLHVQQSLESQMDHYSVFSLTGEQLLEGTLDNLTEIDINNLSQGMYILRLSGVESAVSTRIVKY